MNIRVLASTKIGYSLPKEDAINFSGKSAGICYLPDSVDKLFLEDPQKTLKRANRTIKSKHHSVFGHCYYSLCLEGIPKILAMLLNNEHDYNTSEKSARYTKMTPSPIEEELYYKWIDLFKKQILQEYPKIGEAHATKLAQENARYLISVFTPATTMEYTVDIRQLNYIMYWSEEFIKNAPDNPFNIKLKDVLKEFLTCLPDLRIEGLDTLNKNRGFSLFGTRNRKEYYGETYCVNYISTFSQLAQQQRHRTLKYEMLFLNYPVFYTPPIIRCTKLSHDWNKDIEMLEENYPQGMYILVNERGTIEDFVLKCTERLCGAAQLEIMRQTQTTMDRYKEAVKNSPQLYNYLLPYSVGPACTFPNFHCANPCIWGPKKAFDRTI